MLVDYFHGPPLRRASQGSGLCYTVIVRSYHVLSSFVLRTLQQTLMIVASSCGPRPGHLTRVALAESSMLLCEDGLADRVPSPAPDALRVLRRHDVRKCSARTRPSAFVRPCTVLTRGKRTPAFTKFCGSDNRMPRPTESLVLQTHYPVSRAVLTTSPGAIGF